MWIFFFFLQKQEKLQTYRKSQRLQQTHLTPFHQLNLSNIGVPSLPLLLSLSPYLFRRWEGGSRRKGTYVYLWLIRVDVWQKPAQYCKANTVQKKKKEIPMI